MDMVAGNVKYSKRFFLLLVVLVCFGALQIKSSHSPFIQQESSLVIQSLINNKAGIYLFGFNDCPWCKELSPIFKETLSDTNEQAFVVDTHHLDMKDKIKLENYVRKKTSYEQLVVPLIISISEDGHQQIHIGTVKNHDATLVKLTNPQKNELKNVLSDLIETYKRHNN